MPNLMFYSKFVYKVNAAVRSNFCRIELISYDAPIIWLYKASLRKNTIGVKAKL